MGTELATERLTVNLVVSENRQQVVVRGKISVPEQKPDVEEILSIDKTATVKKVSVIPDKVVVEGTLTLQIVYVAMKPEQSVHHMHDQISFTTFVDVPGARPGMNVKVTVTAEDVKVTRDPDCSGDLDVTAVLDVFAKATEMREIEVLTEVPKGTACKAEKIAIENVVGRGTRQVIVSQGFQVPAEKPGVEKILDADATAVVTGTKMIKNKVLVDGEISVQVMYVAAEPHQPVHNLHRTIEFSDFVEITGAAPGMNVQVDAVVESVEVEVKDTCADFLTVYAVLSLEARVTETRQISVVVCPERTPGVTTRKLHIEQVVGEGTAQVVVRETFTTPDPKPDVQKILDTSVREVKVTETRIIEDKILAAGYVDVSLVYVAALPNQAVHAMHRRLNFRTFVHVPGAREGMELDVRPTVEFIKADARGAHISVELVLKVTARVTESMQREVAVAVEEEEEVPCRPGEIIEHTVQPGDTLYLLAKRYDTTIGKILQLNPQIKDPNVLSVGQVIKIQCGARG